MLAARRTALGKLDIVEVNDPLVAEDEVEVEMRLASVNPFDAQVLRGQIGDPTKLITLGAEGIGLLDGQPVHVSGGGLGAGRDGTYAEKVAVPRGAVREVPSGVSLQAAATVGVAGKTAWRAVHQLARLQDDDVVLVLGASGGVGTFAAQLARLTGAAVLAHTGAESKAERLRRLGLEVVVAADPADLRDAVKDRAVTVVLDPLGGDFTSSIVDVLRPAARIVSYGVLAGAETHLNLATLYGRGLQLLGTSGGTTPPGEARDALDGALKAVATGDVAVDVEILPLESARHALERLARREVHGKLLLDTSRDAGADR